MRVPDIADIRQAASRLAGVAVRTPLLQFPTLDARIDGRVLIKPEVLQRTGSFKFRGAWNRLSQLSKSCARTASMSGVVPAWLHGLRAIMRRVLLQRRGFSTFPR